MVWICYPDTTGDSGEYSVSVSLVSYVVYGQQPGCEQTILGNITGNNSSEIEDQTFMHFCEIVYETDSNAAQQVKIS